MYEDSGTEAKEYGPVTLGSGGLGADPLEGLQAEHRRDPGHLLPTSGEHCTGDDKDRP